MEPKMFTDVEMVNRLHLSHYRLDMKRETTPQLQRIKDLVVFSGDRGEPEYYRAEIRFKTVIYLNCPFQLFSNVHWRIARPDENRTIFPANTIFELGIKSARQRGQVYCLEVGASFHDHEPSPDTGGEPSFLAQQAHRTFFIIACSVEIFVHYQGSDLDEYLKQLRHEAFPGQMERS
ncbi:MAG TPA: hypothetical protein VFB60_19040 [Ktedonobacteraceae bacterium]|nr:hypothetical protein [Ktedonobacteraceae bacterium]